MTTSPMILPPPSGMSVVLARPPPPLLPAVGELPPPVVPPESVELAVPHAASEPATPTIPTPASSVRRDAAPRSSLVSAISPPDWWLITVSTRGPPQDGSPAAPGDIVHGDSQWRLVVAFLA